ncbi:hypothetical protein ACHAWF_004672 [Thalassiosira exigua]
MTAAPTPYAQQHDPYRNNRDATFANSNINFYAAGNEIHSSHNQNQNHDNPNFNELVRRAVQYWLDKSTIHIVPRWILFAVLLALFFLRIYLIQGYFIVAYGLGIFLLNNFIAFLSPLEDPTDVGGQRDDGLSLPSTAKDGKEYRPFARRLPEFKFWMACTRGVGTSIIMTFFSVFDVPVFWPILLMYFGVLFFMTMKRQIVHMYKHKYVPISFGKHKYKDAGKEKGEFGGGMAGSIGQSAGVGGMGGGSVSRRR